MMVIKESKFLLKDFFITGVNWKCFPQEDSTEKLPIIPIDIDFDIFEAKEDKRNFKILMIVSSNNNDEKRPGYHFSIMAEGYFEITDEDYVERKEIKDNYLLMSAVPMMINSIRMYLATLSSNCPFGKWLMPSIDIQDLLTKKFESSHKTKQK